MKIVAGRYRLKSRYRPWGAAVVGFALLSLGMLLVLDNLDLVQAEDFIRFWPLLLVLLGIGALLQPRPVRRIGSGVLLIVVGLALLAHYLDLLWFDIWEMFWPLLFVTVGWSLLWRSLVRSRRLPLAISGEAFDETAFLCGRHRRFAAEDLQGGNVTAMLGGCTIDLRRCTGVAGGQAVVDVLAFWGGVEVRAPRDWAVRVKGTAILGGFTDHTGMAPDEDQRPLLIVRGTSIMAKVRVRQ